MTLHSITTACLSRLQKVDSVSFFIFFSNLLSIFLFLELRVRVRVETSLGHISHRNSNGHKSQVT